MKLSSIASAQGWFEVLQTTAQSQAAVMTLHPGKASGEKGNEHPASDQVLIVVEGELLAEVGSESATLRRGDVVTVPAGIAHRFVNQSGEKVVTLNVYAPPAYPPDEKQN